MVPQLYEVHDAQIAYRECRDLRPVLVIEPPRAATVTVALISAAMDLYRGPTVHFRLDPNHPDFKATGLKKESYVAGDEMFTIEVERLVRRRGQLVGGLLAMFEQWM